MGLGCTHCSDDGILKVQYSNEDPFFLFAAPFAVHNQSPVENEIAGLRESLVVAKGHLSATDEKLNYLQGLVDKLQVQRAVLQTCVDQHTSALSPIRRLPPEMLAEIFTNFLVTKSGKEIDTLDTSSGPWVLAQVCRRWRSIVLSYPKYWASVCIDLDSSTHCEDSPDLLETFLSRSGTHPLSIRFHDPSVSAMGRSLVGVLLGHPERWHKVHWRLLPDSLFWLVPARGRLASLESLTIDRLGSASPMETFDVFERAPRLTRLEVWNVRNVARYIKVPWMQLKSYAAQEMFAEEHFPILRMAGNVIECHLFASANLNRPGLGIPEEDTITLPHLEAMEFRGGHFPSPISTPRLRRVFLESDNNIVSRDEPIKRLCSLISLSSCSLTSLKLRVSVRSHPNMICLFRLVPALTELVLELDNITTELSPILSSLKVTHTGTLLPSLTHLYFTLFSSTRGKYFDLPLFIEMIESRWRIIDQNPVGVARLVHLHFNDEDLATRPELWSTLNTFRKEGLRMFIEPSFLRDLVFGKELIRPLQ